MVFNILRTNFIVMSSSNAFSLFVNSLHVVCEVVKNIEAGTQIVSEDSLMTAVNLKVLNSTRV